MKNSTTNYYNLNAQEYFARTFDIKPTELLDKFIQSIPIGATVMDVGCGSGRDSLYLKENGFNVIPIDASKELADMAGETINQEVIVANIENFKLENPVDGIWAMASLLHLSKNDFKKALVNIYDSLKEDGTFFFALKIGNGEEYDSNGRFFSYYQPEEIENILIETKLFQSISLQITSDNLGRNDTQWLNVFTKKLKLTKTPKP